MIPIKDELVEDYNHERADRALAGVIAYQALAGYPVAGHEHEATEIAATMVDPTKRFEAKDLETSVLDLVNDLIHLADREGLDWGHIMARAATSYQEEQIEP